MKGAEHLSSGPLVASTRMPSLEYINLGKGEIAQEEYKGVQVCILTHSRCRVSECNEDAL